METEINFEVEFVRRYGEYEFILRYLHEALGKKEVTWSDFTAINLTRFVDYLKKRVCPNTVSNYCAFIITMLNLVVDDIDLPTKRFAKILKVRRVPQQNVALTEEELERVYQHYMGIVNKEGGRNLTAEKDVLNLFLIESYCGARSCDAEELTESNIINGRLTYIAKKTNVVATMPVHHRLLELLKHRPKRNYESSSKNGVIKRVLKECGVDYMVTLCYRGKTVMKPKYEFCGTHTARRTFASVLAAKGVPIAEISQYMSHSNLSITERYIKVDTTHVSDGAKLFFGGGDKDEKPN